jgi:hypothetical protein
VTRDRSSSWPAVYKAHRVGTRRFARLELCGFHDASAGRVAARNPVERVTLAVVVEERRHAGESLGMLDVFVRLLRIGTGHVRHVHAQGL